MLGIPKQTINCWEQGISIPARSLSTLLGHVAPDLKLPTPEEREQWKREAPQRKRSKQARSKRAKAARAASRSSPEQRMEVNSPA